MKLRRLFVAVAAVVMTTAFAAPAFGAATAPELKIRSIDTTSFPNVTATVQYTGSSAPSLSDLVVRDGGRIVSKVSAKALAETPTPVGVVLVIDSSGSMASRGRLDAAKAAVKSFVDSRGPSEQIAVVAFNDQARVIHPFSADSEAATAVDGLTASGETALWDAVSVGVGLFADRPDLQGNVVVLSDGGDTVSKQSASAARAAAIAAHVVVDTVGIQGAGLDNGGLEALASATGGESLTTDGASGVSSLFAAVRRSLSQQFELTWKTASRASVDVSVTLNGAVASGHGAAGAVSRGSETRPHVIGSPGAVSNAGAKLGKIIAMVGALLAVGLVVAAVGLYRRQPDLADRIAPYEPSHIAEQVDDGDDGPKSQVSSTLVQRAVDATAQAVEGHGVLEWVEERLDAARLPLRAAEAAFFTVAFALLAGLGAGLAKGPIFGVLALALGIALPAGITSFLAGRRRRKFVKQLPEMLQLLSSSMRAGYALMQGVEAVSQEIADPMGAELRRVMAEAQLGRPVDEALDDAAERMGSPDFAWVVMAISIQRNVGGNLAELLDTVGDTMVARNRLRNEVKALTAEGRVSAMVLGFMPPALGVAMAVMSPGYLNPLFKQTLGKEMLGASIVAMLGGFAWMKKIIKIDL